MNTFSVPADRTGTTFPTPTVPDAAMGNCPCDAVTGVGAVRRDRLTRPGLHALTDAGLDSYILDCIERQNQAQTRWLAAGSWIDAGERDRWMLAEHEARDHRTVRRELRRGRA